MKVSRPNQAFPRRFVFHGNAVAASFFLTKIDGVELEEPAIHPVTGQSSLPVIGGRSESEVLTPSIPAQMASVFSYAGARTMAQGAFQGKNAVTTVEASVSAVRVANRPAAGESDDLSPIEFRAGALSLSLRSTHPPKGLPRIEFAETPQFADVSLNGQPVALELNTELMKLSRWDDLQKRFCTNRKFFESCAFGTGDSKRTLAFGDEIPYSSDSYALCSFVRSVRVGDQQIQGHAIYVAGFGTIYFGEIILNDRERRVTMVRIELGCQSAGQAVLVETDPNGTKVPPR
jgi:hypothetical protein